MFARANCQSKSLGLPFWEALATDTKTAGQVPFMRHAILKMAFTGQPVAPAAMKRLFGKEMISKVEEADAVMKQLRKLMKSAGAEILKDVRLVNILGVTDVNIAKMILGQSLPASEKQYQTIGAVAHDGLLLLRTMPVCLPQMQSHGKVEGLNCPLCCFSRCAAACVAGLSKTQLISLSFLWACRLCGCGSLSLPQAHENVWFATRFQGYQSSAFRTWMPLRSVSLSGQPRRACKLPQTAVDAAAAPHNAKTGAGGGLHQGHRRGIYPTQRLC